MQLTAAAVTLPAEHAARRPVGTAGAAAVDADVRQPPDRGDVRGGCAHFRVGKGNTLCCDGLKFSWHFS
jgi:hypothetical protein